jgi:acyl-coenzyme A thioesterase 9
MRDKKRSEVEVVRYLGGCQDIGSARTPDVTSFRAPNATSYASPHDMRHATRNALQRVGQASPCNSSLLRSSVAFTGSRASRAFHSSPSQRTDGVFRELTSMRVNKPWVEAFRQQQAEGKTPTEASGKPEVSKDRELTPKHMDDSYHSVVLPLARDPWLLDTYLNSSGHIRLGTIFMDLDALSGIIA